MASILSNEHLAQLLHISFDHNKHLKDMVNEGQILAEGKTRSRTYKLRIIEDKEVSLEVNELDGFYVFDTIVAPFLGQSVEPNIIEIWNYGND